MLRGLTAQAKEPDLPLREVGSPIAESLELRRRSMGAGNHVPFGWIGDARPPGPGIDDDHAHVWDLSQANLRAVGRGQCKGGKRHAMEMGRRPVIDRREKGMLRGHRISSAHPFSRMIRPFWRSQSRFFSVSRLSCSFLPLPRPSSTLAMPRALK